MLAALANPHRIKAAHRRRRRVASSVRFPGQYFDAETGLNYNYFRDYEPGTGRYVESDPVGLNGGISTYGYARGDPLRNIDPLGLLSSIQWCLEHPEAAVECEEILPPKPTPEPVKPLVPTPDPSPQDHCEDKPCPPCVTVTGRVVAVGTPGYRPLDTPPAGKIEHEIDGPHYNMYIANQAPRNSPKPCKCFWQPVPAVKPTDLPPGAIPIEPFAD
jgi:RHS repeat-associated protein